MTEKKTEQGVPVYRCELCGGVCFKMDSKITVKTLSAFIVNPPTVIVIEGVPRMIIHECVHGGHGIAIIIGTVPEEVVTAATAPDMHDESDGEGLVN